MDVKRFPSGSIVLNRVRLRQTLLTHLNDLYNGNVSISGPAYFFFGKTDIWTDQALAYNGHTIVRTNGRRANVEQRQRLVDWLAAFPHLGGDVKIGVDVPPEAARVDNLVSLSLLSLSTIDNKSILHHASDPYCGNGQEGEDHPDQAHERGGHWLFLHHKEEPHQDTA